MGRLNDLANDTNFIYYSRSIKTLWKTLFMLLYLYRSKCVSVGSGMGFKDD